MQIPDFPKIILIQNSSYSFLLKFVQNGKSLNLSQQKLAQTIKQTSRQDENNFFGNYISTKHLRVLKNSFTPVCAF